MADEAKQETWQAVSWNEIAVRPGVFISILVEQPRLAKVAEVQELRDSILADHNAALEASVPSPDAVTKAMTAFGEFRRQLRDAMYSYYRSNPGSEDDELIAVVREMAEKLATGQSAEET